ncbi:MAG: ATPase [Deltaproteobacteria bacterium RIFOXYA12_FULL_61_11]|nr:MAG: ATPase [Deltaproteobacteria bacterium RIFOXYA12_FULL_61_11]
MQALQRSLDLPTLLAKKSLFLFGPRAVGKTFWLRRCLEGKALLIDLLHTDTFLRLNVDPSALEGMIRASGQQLIVLDEIQKLPILLDEVHRLIEQDRWTFLLTGSSARKLRHGGVNLLAGRAWVAELFPMTRRELPDFDLARYLRYGGLPSVWLSHSPEEELRAYVHTYLREEIQTEALVRALPSFHRFLRTAALANAQMVNFTNIASDAAVPVSTVREHFSILEDTLLGKLLPAYVSTKKRKALSTAKFYFFDPGVVHALTGTRVLEENTDLFGTSFEQFLWMELRAYLGYTRSFDELCYWRTKHGTEVDFVIGDHTAIEVKAATRITSRDLKGLRTLQEEQIFQRYFLVSRDQVQTRIDGIDALPWQLFLDRLWAGEVF